MKLKPALYLLCRCGYSCFIPHRSGNKRWTCNACQRKTTVAADVKGYQSHAMPALNQNEVRPAWREPMIQL